MNVQHKCLFHPTNSIVKFCESRQCTLPLCYECEPIHMQEHHSQRSQAKILRFNEATLKATNDMEDYLDAHRKFQREQSNKIKSDREVCIQMIEQYCNIAHKMMVQIKENAAKVQENLNKLKKGSIKSLIFYYSGDVKLNSFSLEFEPLQIKLQKIFENREGKTEMDGRKNENNYQVHQQLIDEQATQLNQKSDMSIEYPNTKNLKNKQSDNQNVFSSIQQIKEERGKQRSRKSIFDQTKKNSIISQNNGVLKQAETKFYYRQKENLVQQNLNPTVLPYPKFNYDLKYQEYKYKNQKSSISEPEILSFQNRFLNNFLGEQNDAIDKNQACEAIIRDNGRNDRNKCQQVLNNKILKPQDLEIEKQNGHFGARQKEENYTLSQRNRSMSQNHMVDKQTRKTNYDYDLKRQVLSPDQIRKMLQKKIEERNRILSIKKTDNYPIQLEQKGRKGWETRDSIINQIYTDAKY